MKKKWVSASLVLVMGASLLAACSNNGGGNTPPANTGENTGTPEAPAKQTFTFLNYSNPSWPYDENWPIWSYLEEATGVTLDIETPPGGSLEDTLALTVASGNLPDLLFTFTKPLADKYGQQGALVNILDYVDQMPNFKAWMEEHPAAVQSAIASNGEMYIFPNQGIGETNRMIWMYREDVFSEHGLEQPETWDELYETLKELKQLYPDSYPLTFRSGLRYLMNFGASFETVGSMNADLSAVYYDFDKEEWVYGATEDNFKTLVEYMNKFYAEKLIPPDFLTVDTKLWQDMMSTNRAFVTLDYVGRIDFFNSALRAENPDFNLNFMAPPAGWDGGARKNAFTQVSQEGFMISSKTKKIDDIIKFMDFFYSEEGRTLVSWGKEGESYKEENGAKQFIETFTDVSDMRKKMGLSTDGTYIWFDYDAHISLASPELKTAYEQGPQYDSEQQPIPAFTAEEQEVLSTVGDALNKNRDENISKFIIGERSLAEWDSYVAEQNKLGVDKIVDTFTQAYDRTMNATN
ncbi:extracellular solute-binding protein [Paenibacillus daejeonensis]|uniref:extracellular solute-binding protein n=1 Tax=Paenibacillus daejeonensis TaxID=135193 RepID=UPI00035EFAB6|nr:extracellular solute-binding protein [Paenibacillus daejeonensis]